MCECMWVKTIKGCVYVNVSVYMCVYKSVCVCDWGVYVSLCVYVSEYCESTCKCVCVGRCVNITVVGMMSM